MNISIDMHLIYLYQVIVISHQLCQHHRFHAGVARLKPLANAYPVAVNVPPTVKGFSAQTKEKTKKQATAAISK